MLNNLYPSLKFTFKKETDKQPLFLDVCVEKRNHVFETKVYRKPTFIGQYIRRESFCSISRKLNLISTLIHRALKICTRNHLKQEMENIKKILPDNGYPEDVIKQQILRTAARFSTPKPFGSDKCPFYLKVPCMGEPSTKLSSAVKAAVDNCFASVNPRVIFTSKSILPIARKDVVPATKKNIVIYEFQCHCDSWYVGCTLQRLEDRIRQHVPKWIRSRINATRTQPSRSNKKTTAQPDCHSAIGQHLLKNIECAKNYEDTKFSILTTARSQFQLRLLKATRIKIRQPSSVQTKRVCILSATI